jgi:predicted oxidoreductase
MITQKIGGTQLEVSRVALGCMGMAGTWNPKDVGPDNIARAINAFEAALENGITFFDHADIYGGTACESVFKECLAAVPGAREQIVIATKCGILRGYYNLSQEYIEQSIHGSLERMGIEYVDLYQMHRPDPLTHPSETAAALKKLVADGLVRHVGVSNYYPEQVRALAAYMDGIPLVSNQISISLLRLDPIYEGWDGGDGVLDQCNALGMSPLAYSPLSGSTLSKTDAIADDNPRKNIIDGVRAQLVETAQKYNAKPSQIAIAWLLKHPAGIVPLVGSNNPAHIVDASKAADIDLDRQDWYKLWTAAWGRDVP